MLIRLARLADRRWTLGHICRAFEKRDDAHLVVCVCFLADDGVLQLVGGLVEELLVLTDQKFADGLQLALSVCY